MMDYLEAHYPELWVSINDPTDIPSSLYENASETAVWSTIGESAAATSLWAFWRAAFHLEHLHSLEHQRVQPNSDPVQLA